MNRTMVDLIALPILTLSLAACAGTATQGPKVPDSQASAPATDPRTPGATGKVIVPGDASTITGDRKATRIQQTDPFVPSN